MDYELILPLNQISYPKNLRICYARKTKNKCLTTNIAVHVTASDSYAFDLRIRRSNFCRQGKSGTKDWLRLDKEETGMGKRTFHTLRQQLENDGLVSKDPNTCRWTYADLQ